MKIGEINQIALAVSDLKASIRFYRDTLGQKLLFEAEPAMAFFKVGGLRLMLSQAEEVNPGGPILYFSTQNIEKAYQELKKSGVNCLRKPLLTHKTDHGELWFAFFTDPDGHTLGLMENKPVSSK